MPNATARIREFAALETGQGAAPAVSMDHCPGKTALVTDLSFSYPTDPRCDAGLLLETSDAGLKF
jgi:hypothetical protein